MLAIGVHHSALFAQRTINLLAHILIRVHWAAPAPCLAPQYRATLQEARRQEVAARLDWLRECAAWSGLRQQVGVTVCAPGLSCVWATPFMPADGNGTQLMSKPCKARLVHRCWGRCVCGTCFWVTLACSWRGCCCGPVLFACQSLHVMAATSLKRLHLPERSRTELIIGSTNPPHLSQALLSMDASLVWADVGRGAVLQRVGEAWRGILVVREGLVGVYAPPQRTCTLGDLQAAVAAEGERPAGWLIVLLGWVWG